MTESFEKILNLKKVRYEILDGLFRRYKSVLVPESTVNIFIDIPSTVKQLYNPDIIKGLSGNISKRDKYVISSVLLNMIGHYRNYFATRHQCYTNIVFMYNSKIDSHIKDKLDPDYRKTYYDKRFLLENPVFSDLNILLKDNYQMMKTIIDFIPHCWFADSLYRDYRSIFPFMTNLEEFKDNINIIITSDKLMYQNGILGETLILEPKGDVSTLINPNYIIKSLFGKVKTLEKHPEYLTLSPENIILLESLINHKDLDTNGIRNFSYLKALEFLYKNDIDINNVTISTEYIKELFKDKLEPDEIDVVVKNFKIYNNCYLAKLYEKDLTLMYKTWNKFIVDYKELRKTNEVLYAKHPLNLDFYFKGESTD